MDASNRGRARFGLFELNLESGELKREGKPLKLQAQPARVLALLVSRAGELTTRRAIQHHIWPDNYVEFDHSINYCIRQIRLALNDNSDSPAFLETIPRQGYRFIAPVEYLGARGESRDEQRQTATRPRRGYRFIALVRRLTGGAQVDESAQGNQDTSESSLSPAGESSGILSPWRRRRWPIAVAGSVAIALAATFYYSVAGREARPTPSIRSVAVLPFKLIGPEDERFLGLGISDAVITKLGNLPEVTVRPTGAVLKYEDMDIDPVTAGRELGVESLLSGVVQKSGNQIRLTVQLTRVSDGASLWAGKFEENFTDIFDLQDTISRRLAESLMPQVSANEREVINRPSTENIEAYVLFMRGRYSVNKGTGESMRKGIAYFEKALALDPDFAAAHALIARVYTMLGFYRLMSPDEAMLRARPALARALELDRSNAEALTAQAFIKMHYDYDWPGAEQAFLRALDQNPQYLPARHGYAWWLLIVGREEESAAEMKRGYEIDPVTPSSSLDRGLHLIHSRLYEQAIEHHRSLIELEPGLALARWDLAITYSLKGMHEEAIAEGQRAMKVSEEKKCLIGYIYSAAGRRAEAMKILAELNEMAKTEYVSPCNVARIYSELGELDRAFEMLDRAFREQDQKIFWLRVDPTFDRLRDDARYAKIMRRMKLKV